MEQTDIKMSTVVFNDGRIKCTSGSGIEIIFRIPRKSLAKCAGIDELNHGGIYLLVGERDGHQMIYLGHSVGGLFDKLREHDRDTDKNFWTEALVFTTANNSFGAREIIWLEDKFVDELKSTNNLVVKIDDDESPDNFEAHADFARFAFSEVNHKIFEHLAAQDNEEIFYLERTIKKLGRKVHAQMKITLTGYRVLAGSEICPLDAEYLSKSSKERRHSAKVVDGKLAEDVEFLKPSPAAEFVSGMSEQGYVVWKTKDGVTLNDFLGGN